MKKVKNGFQNERPELGAGEASRHPNVNGYPVEVPLVSQLNTDLSTQYLTVLRQTMEVMAIQSGSTRIPPEVSQNTRPAQARLKDPQVLESPMGLLTKRLHEQSELVVRQLQSLANTGEQLNTAYLQLRRGVESLNRNMGKSEEYLNSFKLKSED